MKKEFTLANLELVKISVSDVVATSGDMGAEIDD